MAAASLEVRVAALERTVAAVDYLARCGQPMPAFAHYEMELEQLVSDLTVAGGGRTYVRLWRGSVGTVSLSVPVPVPLDLTVSFCDKHSVAYFCRFGHLLPSEVYSDGYVVSVRRIA